LFPSVPPGSYYELPLKAERRQTAETLTSSPLSLTIIPTKTLRGKKKKKQKKAKKKNKKKTNPFTLLNAEHKTPSETVNKNATKIEEYVDPKNASSSGLLL